MLITGKKVKFVSEGKKKAEKLKNNKLKSKPTEKRKRMWGIRI